MHPWPSEQLKIYNAKAKTMCSFSIMLFAAFALIHSFQIMRVLVVGSSGLLFCAYCAVHIFLLLFPVISPRLFFLRLLQQISMAAAVTHFSLYPEL